VCSYSPDHLYFHLSASEDEGLQLDENLIKITLKHNLLQSDGALLIESSTKEVRISKPKLISLLLAN